MTYNVRGLRHGVDRVADVIRSHEPDVVLVQESGPRRRFRRLVRELSVNAASDPRSPFRRRVQNAILVRPPLQLGSVRLHRFSRGERWYPRGALVGELAGAGRRLSVVSVHLGMRPRDRRRHARELIERCAGLEDPLVLGGDLNEGPDGAAVMRIAQTLTDAWAVAGTGIGETIYAWDRRLRIDYVFVSGDIEPVTCLVPAEPEVVAASDHLPVVADVTIG